MMLEEMSPLGGYQQNRALGRGLGKEGIQYYTQLMAGSGRDKGERTHARPRNSQRQNR
jgi:hypothetical protein